MKKKRQVVVTPSMRSNAFVMPEKHEPTEAEIDAMAEEEYDEYARHHAPVDKDGLSIAHTPPWTWEDRWDDDRDDDEWAERLATDTEKAAAPIIGAAIDADFRGTVPHGAPVEGIEFEDCNDAVRMLLLAVTMRVNTWKKPPKPAVTAAAIGLALTHHRGTKGVKHPRDIAKEVGVRPQTLFKVRKIALELIVELGISGSLPEVRE